MAKIMTQTERMVKIMSEEKKALVHEDELAAIKDSRKRNIPLFAVMKDDCNLWIVAVSEHQAKMALIDRVYPMEKQSKKDRDYRYLHLLESAASPVVANTESEAK